MKKHIDLSIIIVSYNTKTLLEQCLESIYVESKENTLTFEVIVVDNGSTDGSIELLKKNYSHVILIKNNTNVGFGRANNQGAAASSGAVLLFLNSDIIVLSRAVEKLYQFFTAQKSECMIGGKLFNTDNTPQPSCGPHYSLPAIFAALFLKGDYINLTRYSPNVVKKVDWIMGACMMMHKKTFMNVGRFDESIFMYMEEIDLEYRAKKTGVEILFYPDAHFIHVGAASSQGRTNPILNVFRGFIYFYKKHYPPWKNLILRILLLTKAAIAYAIYSVTLNKNGQERFKQAFKIAITA